MQSPKDTAKLLLPTGLHRWARVLEAEEDYMVAACPGQTPTPWAGTHTLGWDAHRGLGHTPWAGTHTLSWDTRPGLGHTLWAGTHALGWDTRPGLGHTPWALQSP